MELIIYNQQETPELIRFNHKELKKELTERLSHYNSLTYTDTEIKTAKADRATLNKFKEAIEKRRKEIKSNCLKPYEDFETKVKEIVKMIEQPILAIDGQVKTFEEKVKSEKRNDIDAFYSESIGDLASLLPLAKVWNDKWLNSSVTIKSVKDEIAETIARVNSDLEVISNLQSEFALQVKDVYLRSLNLSAALQEKTRLEDQKAKQDSYDKLQAERAERLRLERIEAKKAEAEQLQREPLVITVETEPDGHALTQEGYENIEKAFAQPERVAEVIEPEVKQIDFRVWATSEQLGLLKTFLLEQNIKYGKVV